MGRGLSEPSEGGGLRHRFHSICPYFAMFPRPSSRSISLRAGETFPKLKGRVTDFITSPPYLDTTNYREDQWLRLWFLAASH